MYYYFLLASCLAALCEATLRYNADQTYASSYSHPQYHFSYAVKDTYTGDDKAQWEERDGDKVVGAYRVQDPNGKHRTVKYTADDAHGFEANVENQAVFHAPIVVTPSHVYGQEIHSVQPTGFGYDFVVDHNEHVGPTGPTNHPSILATGHGLVSGYEGNAFVPSALGGSYGKDYGYDVSIDHTPYALKSRKPQKAKFSNFNPSVKSKYTRKQINKKIFRVPASAKKVIIHTGKYTKSLTITPALSSKKIIIKHKGKVYKYKKGRLVQINIKKNKKKLRKPKHGQKIYFPLE